MKSRHLVFAGALGGLCFVSPFALAGETQKDMHQGMDHSQHMQAMQHQGHDMKGMDHSQHKGMDHSQHQGMGGGEHAAHMAMLKQTGHTRSVQHYRPPALEVVDFQGRKTSLPDELPDDKPILLNFIYTTCPTICPVLSATFAQVQRDLGDEVRNVRMVSITIDPEKDTPDQLRKYAEKFDAGPQWQFLTGKLENIIAIEKAFDIYRGSKVNHVPAIFLRPAHSKEWIRLNGLVKSADVVAEYRKLAKND